MLCVIVKLDEASTEYLSSLRLIASAWDTSVKPLYGHITLASYIGEDEETFVGSCIELLGELGSFGVFYEKVEALYATSIIVASPRPEGELMRIHGAIANAWGEHLDEWTGTFAFKPHTTLYYKPAGDLETPLAAVRGAFEPFTARAEAVEFSRPVGEGYEIIGRLKLK